MSLTKSQYPGNCFLLPIPISVKLVWISGEDSCLCFHLPHSMSPILRFTGSPFQIPLFSVVCRILRLPTSDYRLRILPLPVFTSSFTCSSFGCSIVQYSHHIQRRLRSVAQRPYYMRVDHRSFPAASSCPCLLFHPSQIAGTPPSQSRYCIWLSSSAISTKAEHAFASRD